jgi:hypothetical protein
MLAKRVIGIAALAACVLPLASARAQTLVERSAESRLQIDFAVADAAIKKVLPAGWETDVATAGGAKDCNLRMIFIDRFDITGPDDAARGTSQLAILEVPVKNPGTGLAGRMVIDGITVAVKDAPGPFGVYHPSTGYRIERSTATVGLPVLVSENWDLSATNGEHMELHLKYQRDIARRSGGEVKFFSGADPSFYQIGKIAQGLVPMRNATVPGRDLVSEFQYKATGGNLGALFDGSERLISIDAIGWHDRAVYLP